MTLSTDRMSPSSMDLQVCRRLHVVNRNCFAAGGSAAQLTRAADINVGVLRRSFKDPNEFGTESASEAAFDTQLQTTVDEIKLVIRMYEKYGDPNPPKERPHFTIGQEIVHNSINAAPVAPALELVPPEKVTFPWLVKHVSVKQWAGVALAVFVIFGAGVSASRWPLVQDILKRLFP